MAKWPWRPKWEPAVRASSMRTRMEWIRGCCYGRRRPESCRRLRSGGSSKRRRPLSPAFAEGLAGEVSRPSAYALAKWVFLGGKALLSQGVTMKTLYSWKRWTPLPTARSSRRMPSSSSLSAHSSSMAAIWPCAWTPLLPRPWPARPLRGARSRPIRTARSRVSCARPSISAIVPSSAAAAGSTCRAPHRCRYYDHLFGPRYLL